GKQAGATGAEHNFTFMGGQHRIRAETQDGQITLKVASRQFNILRNKLQALHAAYAERLTAGGHGALLARLDGVANKATSAAQSRSHAGAGGGQDLDAWLD